MLFIRRNIVPLACVFHQAEPGGPETDQEDLSIWTRVPVIAGATEAPNPANAGNSIRLTRGDRKPVAHVFDLRRTKGRSVSIREPDFKCWALDCTPVQ